MAWKKRQAIYRDSYKKLKIYRYHVNSSMMMYIAINFLIWTRNKHRHLLLKKCLEIVIYSTTRIRVLPVLTCLRPAPRLLVTAHLRIAAFRIQTAMPCLPLICTVLRDEVRAIPRCARKCRRRCVSREIRNARNTNPIRPDDTTRSPGTRANGTALSWLRSADEIPQTRSFHSILEMHRDVFTKMWGIGANRSAWRIPPIT